MEVVAKKPAIKVSIANITAIKTERVVVLEAKKLCHGMFFSPKGGSGMVWNRPPQLKVMSSRYMAPLKIITMTVQYNPCM